MNQQSITRVGIVGCGGMARHHIRQMLKQPETTQIVVLCEPSEAECRLSSDLFTQAGLEPPPSVPTLDMMLRDYADKLDAALIITPHAYHHDQAATCMNAGLDVLLEKPMVINTQEAESLMQTRDRTGRLLVVAFQGSLSPQIRTAVRMLRSGELGKLLTISGTVWQNWGALTQGSWRQQPSLSGGGFLFDTGAHMLNTLSDLAGEDFVEVAAWLDNNGRPVETIGVVMARLKSGAFVTVNGCGEAIPSCTSEIWLFCSKGIVRTGQWGERLELQRAGEDQPQPVDVPRSMGAWEQFLAVRAGKLENPCPPEVGLRMAHLYDAIRNSAAQHGQPVQLHTVS